VAGVDGKAMLRLLAADLLVFDRERLAWGMAARTTAALMLPLLAAHLLAQPLLYWIGIGAFLLAIGDAAGEGEPGRAGRLLLASLAGGLALACGVLAGGALPLALAGMLAWGFLTGLAGVYGNAAAAMALPVAWAYLELGLPASDRSAAHATTLAGLFVLGGLLVLALNLAAELLPGRLPGGGSAAYRPLRRQAAACFRALADCLATPDEAAGPAVNPETRARAAIAQARRTAAQTRHDRQGVGSQGRRLALLVESAERLFVLATGLRGLAPGAVPPPLLAGLEALASGRIVIAPALRRDLAALAAPGGHSSASAMFHGRIAMELLEALRIAGGDAGTDARSVAGPRDDPGRRPARLRLRLRPRLRLQRFLRPPASALHRDSVVGRHALRFAVTVTAAVAVYWVFPGPFGYWVPLTVSVVLKPYAGITLSRTVQRCLGTAAGILAGAGLLALLAAAGLDGQAAWIAIVCLSFFALLAVLPFNYSLAIAFLSIGLVPFEHLLQPDLQLDIGLSRLLATGTGAVLAVVGGHLLWPSFERDSLPALLRASLRSMAGYADAVLRLRDGGQDHHPARRRAGLDSTNLQAAIQHAASEPGGDPAMLEGAIQAGAALQRIANVLNGLATAPVPDGAADVERARNAVVAELERLAASIGNPASDRIPEPADARTDALHLHAAAAPPLLREGLDAIGRQLDLLSVALRRPPAQVPQKV